MTGASPSIVVGCGLAGEGGSVKVVEKFDWCEVEPLVAVTVIV